MELKLDILSGKLHAEKIEERYFVSEADLESAYSLPLQKELKGMDYYLLKLQGWTLSGIVNKMLLPQCRGNYDRAVKIAAGFESHIKRGTYKSEEEKYADIKKNSQLLEERTGLIKLLEEKKALGLVDDVKNIEDKLKKTETVSCKLSKTELDLKLQLPIPDEKHTEEGLFKNLYDFFISKTFFDEMNLKGIHPVVSKKEGYVTFCYAGKQNQILNTLKERLDSGQPIGFAEARLRLALFIPGDLSILDNNGRKDEHGGQLYTPEQIDKMYGTMNPQQRAWLTMDKKIKPILCGRKRMYNVLIPPEVSRTTN